MVLLEVPAAIRRANKYDLFIGELDNLEGVQDVKENTTVFYLDYVTNKISGPYTIYSWSNFSDIYRRTICGKCGVLISIPDDIKNVFLFDLVVREAFSDDLKDTSRHIMQNRIFYTYIDHIFAGPYYTDNSTTMLFLDNLIAKKQIFIPNERQHFKKRTLQKAG